MHNRRTYLKYIHDAEYPATPESLLALADCNQAPAEILDILEELPDVDFESADDVAEACSMVEKGLLKNGELNGEE